MRRPCPYCGSTNTEDDEKNKILKCNKCGRSASYSSPKQQAEQKDENKEKQKKDKKESKPPRNKEEKEDEDKKKEHKLPISSRLTKTIIFTATAAVAIIVNLPTFNLINSALLAVTAPVVPIINLADIWGLIIIVIYGALLCGVAYSVWTTNSIGVGVVWLLGIGIVIFAFFFLPSILEAVGFGEYGTAFGPLLCVLKGGDPFTCQVAGTTEPEVVKIGDYEVLNTYFDTEYTGNVIYKVEDRLNFGHYFLNLVVENPSDTITIRNFKILDDSYLRRSGIVKTSEKIKLADIKTTDRECMDSPCDISPGSTLILTLEATPVNFGCSALSENTCKTMDVCEWDGTNCIEGVDTKTKELEARVKLSYDYAGEGKFSFVVTKSDEVLDDLLATRKEPTKSDGPLDVIVYFTPTAYVFRGSTTEQSIGVVIKLSKDDPHTAYIKEPIRINRLSDGVMERPGVCSTPWGEGASLDEDEKLWVGGEWALKKSHTYICDYTVKKELVGEDGEEIPFIVRADYTYEKTITHDHIMVEILETGGGGNGGGNGDGNGGNGEPPNGDVVPPVP